MEAQAPATEQGKAMPADQVHAIAAAGEPAAPPPLSPEDAATDQKLQAAITANPDAAQPYAQRAAFLMGHQRNEEAVGLYQQAIMRDPENPKLFLAIAVAYLHGGSYERAQVMAQQALTLDPKVANGGELLEYIDAKIAAEEEAAAALSGAAASPDGEAPKASH